MAEKKPKQGKVPKGGGGELISLGPERPKCCVSSFSAPVFNGPARVIGIDETRRKAGRVYNILLRFENAEGPNVCRCRCCEFRHYVRGFLSYDGMKRNCILADGLLSETRWLELAVDTPEGLVRYGHREDENRDADFYGRGERPVGCSYIGTNFPGLIGARNVAFEIDLEFRGDIIDVCNRNAVVASRTWKIQMKGKLNALSKFYSVGGQ